MFKRHTTSPLTAVVIGGVAGAVGTLAMDAMQYARQRAENPKQSFWDYESGAHIEDWGDVSAPGKLGHRVANALLRKPLPPEAARPMNNAMHWAYGIAWGALYGVVNGTFRTSARWTGPLFGLVIFATDYVILPPTGVYKPITEYDTATLARDANAHIVYGAVTARVFRALTPPVLHPTK